MGDESPTVFNASSKIVVLAFKLTDAETGLLPGQLERAMFGADVQDAIKKTLQQFTETKFGQGITPVSQTEIKDLSTSVLTAAKDAAQESLIKQVKSTKEFKLLETSIEDFKKTVETSKFGVFIDKNKNILYVIGAALVIGGGATLFLTKTSGILVEKPIELLKGKEFEVLSIGHFTAKASLLEFKPDARIYGAELTLSQEFTPVNVSLKFAIKGEDKKINEISGEALLTSKNFTAKLTSEYKPIDCDLKLAINMDFNQSIGKNKINLSLGSIYQKGALQNNLGANFTMKNGPTIGLAGNLNVNQSGSLSYGALAKISLTF